MSEIVLRRANVVKCVDSEDKALALELKGFVRNGEKTVKEQLEAAVKQNKAAGKK